MTAIKKHPYFRALCGYLVCFLFLAQAPGCSKAKPLYPTNITRSTQISDFYGSTVAVLHFENNTEIGQAGDIMESQFAMAVMRSGKFELVDRSHMDALLGERDLADEGVSETDPREIGRLLGVKAVIVGSVTDAKPYKYVSPSEQPTVTQEQTVIVQTPSDTDSGEKKAKNGDDADSDGAWGWLVAGIVAVLAIITFYWLWGDRDDPQAARIGAYVKMIDVDTGKILWQGEEIYSGGDPRVKVLVPENRQEELKKELTAVAGLLSEELVDTM